MKRFDLIAASIGFGCGLLLPVDGITTAPPSAEGSGAERYGAEGDGESGPCPQLETAGVEREIEKITGEVALFREDWGQWVDPPQGWDPAAEETRLRAIADLFPNELSAVSCELYPCVLLMASTDAVSRAVVEAAFGVAGRAVGIATSAGQREIHTVSVAAIDTTTLDEAELRWVTRLRVRLENEMGADVDRLLAQAEEDVQGPGDDDAPTVDDIDH